MHDRGYVLYGMFYVEPHEEDNILSVQEHHEVANIAEIAHTHSVSTCCTKCHSVVLADPKCYLSVLGTAYTRIV